MRNALVAQFLLLFGSLIGSLNAQTNVGSIFGHVGDNSGGSW
jgi:hypothetical protein